MTTPQLNICLVKMEDGDQAEVDMVGHEGMLGTLMLSEIEKSYDIGKHSKHCVYDALASRFLGT